MILCVGSVKEADFAGEDRVRIKPDFSSDPQSAADLIKLLALRPDGGAVRGHAIRLVFPIDQPGHIDVIWVESGRQADQGLLPCSFFMVPTLIRRRWEQRDCWSSDTDSWFWTEM